MKLEYVGGTTSCILNVFIQDSASTTGAGKTGLAYNTASLTAYYVRPGAASVAITLATQTATGAYSSGGFVEIDATNMPGMYRFDIPNAALAAGATSVAIMLKGASGMVPLTLEIALVAWNPQDAVRGGFTALPNATAGATNGLPLSVDSSGRVDVLKINGTNQTARDLGASVLLSSGTGAGQIALASGAVTVGTNNDKSGYALTTAPLDAAGTRGALGLATANLDTQLAAIQADTDNLQTRIPAALVSGRMDASVGAMAANVLTAAAMAADAGAEIADAVWDEAISGHLAAGTTGAALNGAGSAGDPWNTALPGVYAEGTAGNLVGIYIDAAISSRLAAASYTAPVTANDLADAVLKRDWTSVSGEAARSLLNAARTLRNRVVISSGVITVYKEDGATVAFTMPVTTDANAEPIIAVTPA